MTLARLSALTAAIMITSAAQANSLIDDGTLDIHLRNYYMDKSAQVAGSPKDANQQWAQAINADFSSGYLANLIGFDLGAYYALKLKADDVLNANASDANLLQTNNGQPKSYGKTSYAIKINLADMGMAKYGRMFLDTPLLNNNYSRSLPGLTEAFYAESHFDGVHLYGIWATKSNMRTESGFMDLMVNGEKEAVKILGGSYEFDHGVSVNLAAGQQHDVARKYYADLGYEMDMQSVNIDSRLQYGRSRARGFTKTNLDSGVDEAQSSWGMRLTAGMHHATLGLSYQTVSQSGQGYVSSWKGQGDEVDDSGYFGPHSLMISDFNGDGQTSWGVHAGYDFADMVDGLSVNAVYAKGGIDAKADAKDTNENEYNLTASYAFPQVDNLSVAARYAKNTSKVKTSGEKTTKKQIRFIVKYDMSVF